jgi:AAA+ ATPase superfamily predicted ATPase
MKLRQIFPLGKAYGRSFCNRTSETKKLVGHIESGKHTFLVAPRRYGKSSLCEHAFEQINFAWTKIDFHVAVTDKDAERIVINGVTELISKSLGSASEKLMLIAKKYAKKLQPKLSLGVECFRLELNLVDDSSPAENIAEALLILEKLLREKDKQAVLLLDEFQEISSIKNGRGIEGAIRSAAQETQNLSIIFCGSNPHLLRAMFEDERRPLYKLCRKLVLDRISTEHYKEHINKAAIEIWKEPLSDEAFEKIMFLSERHPYYVNYLCDELCSEYDAMPTLTEIDDAWNMVVEEERSDLIKDFSGLTHNQRKLMIHIANHGGSEIYSAKTSQKTEIPISSISRVLSSLIEKDYIERIGDTYRLIAPVYKKLLSE